MNLIEFTQYIKDNFKYININEYNFHQIKEDQVNNGPKKRDFFYVNTIILKQLYLIKECDCNCVIPEFRWPLKGIDSECGAHIVNPITPHKEAGVCWRNGEWLLNGWWLQKKESIITEVKQSTNTPKGCCPKCGSLGDDLIFAFYCTNKSCRNYHL